MHFRPRASGSLHIVDIRLNGHYSPEAVYDLWLFVMDEDEDEEDRRARG